MQTVQTSTTIGDLSVRAQAIHSHSFKVPEADRLRAIDMAYDRIKTARRIHPQQTLSIKQDTAIILSCLAEIIEAI